MDSNKEKFIKSQIFYLTIMGAFGRHNIYKDGVIEKNKRQFHTDLKSLLEKLEDKYKNKKIETSEHLIVLDKLKKDIENKGRNVLKGSSISFGTVQKLLNLYLKYLWILDKISIPPHCPFDYIIISELKANVPPWTKKDFTEKHYNSLIKLAENKAAKNNYKNLAEWELECWNNYLEKQNN